MKVLVNVKFQNFGSKIIAKVKIVPFKCDATTRIITTAFWTFVKLSHIEKYNR
jgi:hypothetical protein